jgi:hypothetical protein
VACGSARSRRQGQAHRIGADPRTTADAGSARADPVRGRLLPVLVGRGDRDGAPSGPGTAPGPTRGPAPSDGGSREAIGRRRGSPPTARCASGRRQPEAARNAQSIRAPDRPDPRRDGLGGDRRAGRAGPPGGRPRLARDGARADPGPEGGVGRAGTGARGGRVPVVPALRSDRLGQDGDLPARVARTARPGSWRLVAGARDRFDAASGCQDLGTLSRHGRVAAQRAVEAAAPGILASRTRRGVPAGGREPWC